MTKFQKETRHQLCVHFHKKKQQQQWQRLTLQNVRQKHAHMVCSVHLHRHDMLTDPLTVQLQA